MQLQILLDEYSKQLDLGTKLQLNSQGICELKLNEEHQVTVESSADPSQFYIYAAVGPVSPNNSRQLRELLSGNLFGRNTGTASLAIDEASGQIVLFSQLSVADTNATELKNAFGRFVAVLELWKSKISAGSDTGLLTSEARLTGFLKDEQMQVFFV